ncbi:lysophospholipase L1-like esterase [Pullulanibacillus pueri]|uniref:SGNH hydrolase-type esterase domain-containing protein n=1 Tax=Pullulanibacillus pueri TaxID=1437324 RepID=A0A8J3ELG0_9BACL|nr:SGNH/GDSL hydrolase family protein [Pullulanibacillus pueri]MBM7682307.1 lysophospholipase L1-like esterase [Pullulanibacillus pueri]GGH80858.1 hypothetical protein GCM10007096_17890 [Pullulanibacillus pueri]
MEVVAFKRKKRWTVWGIFFLIIALVIGLSFVYHKQFAPYEGSPQNLKPFQSSLKLKQMSLNITAIGDSLTEGVGDPEDQGYAGLTAKALENSKDISTVDFKNHGIKGDTTNDLQKVLKDQDVQSDLANADLIFLTIGGNDLVGVVKKNILALDIDDFNEQRIAYTKNLNSILAEIRQDNPSATIYYMGLYNPFEDYLGGLNEQFKAIIDEWNSSSQTILNLYSHTVFVPTFDLFEGKGDQLLYTDHFHPNKAGYQLMADRLQALIEK